MQDHSLGSLENLSANEWITPLEAYNVTMPDREGKDVKIRVEPNGVPLQVLAIDVPFLVVRTPTGLTWTMDGRRLTKWKKLHPFYVLMVLSAYAQAATPAKTA